MSFDGFLFFYCMNFLKKMFGEGNIRLVKKLQPVVEQINGFESALLTLSDEELKAKTIEFKDRLSKGDTLETILPEAFAVVREASRRVTGMRHYDVQMIGGIVLHRGMIAEMRTGEGKTLVATLPTYLNALAGKGVHVVTVNDYLAKRDAVWMGKIYDFLGLSIGIIQNMRVSYVYDSTVIRPEELLVNDEHKETENALESFKIEDEFLRPSSRQEAYRCDITYGTNNEFGFDYLRDNMVQGLGEMVMRPGNEMHFAIVDEVDSILIDEARTPLIISAPAEEATEQYYQFADLVRQLKENEDYNVDEKMRTATLTESGITKFETWLNIPNIYEEGGIKVVHHIEQALKAEVLFKRNKDYLVENNGEIIIIDEFTGRKMPGRRYSEGLHQALEAKEGVSIQRESQTLATITFQNLFRMYGKLSGMTGTAATESEELFKIYHLEVVVIPTNKIDQRTDLPDRIYKTETAKFRAVAERIKECHIKKQPILVGTISVEKNERLSEYLTSIGIPHEVLNAKNHEREGEIIAQAGRPGAVTLATNMAGRGVDIKLGGVPAVATDIETVVKAGGLFVLGTERHESRRIDNQLRGRAARQGDPGMTQFFVSTDDDLLRIFGGDRLKNVMTRLKVPEDMPIEQNMLSSLLENAQKKVEAHNFDIRKHLLEYADVLNKQRTVVYEKRRRILEYALKKPAELTPLVTEMVEQEIETVVSYHTNSTEGQLRHSSGETKGDWNIQEIYESMKTVFPLSEQDRETLFAFAKRDNDNFSDVVARDKIVSFLIEKSTEEYHRLATEIAKNIPDETLAETALHDLEKGIMLRAIDTFWVDHLVAIDYLRAGIGLQGYGQRDPLIEYKKQSFVMFNQLLADIQKEVVYSFFKIGAGIQLAPSIMATDELTLKGAEKVMDGEEDHNHAASSGNSTHSQQKVGRNDACPCGSGKKFKRCHGA